MLELFISALFLGFVFNAMPGAIFAESFRRGIQGGFNPAFAVQIGSLAGDFVWAILGLTGAAVLFSLPLVEKPLAIIGVLLLSWIAFQAIRDGLSPFPNIHDPQAKHYDKKSALITGASLSLSNPLNISYWAALGGTVTALGASHANASAFTVFLTGFMLSSIVWCFICAGLIAWLRNFIGPFFWKIVNYSCALCLIYFSYTILKSI